MNQEQLSQIKTGNGFIAALDQSGGSTPKALAQYGVSKEQYAGENEMFDLMHAMRARMMTAPAFTGDRIIGAILFEGTMDREVMGKPTAQFLWEGRHVVPFLKVDKGLADEIDGVQLMKPIPDLGGLLERAKSAGIFGTKMRSVINGANQIGIAAVVEQQFAVAKQILSHGLVPIVEPEVTISIADKSEAEALLKAQIVEQLGRLAEGQQIMLKLSLPSTPDFYAKFITHPNVLRVVALSGGYSRDEANSLLAENHGLIASFSRALSEGLSASQSDDEFNSTIAQSVVSIYQASLT